MQKNAAQRHAVSPEEWRLDHKEISALQSGLEQAMDRADWGLAFPDRGLQLLRTSPVDIVAEGAVSSGADTENENRAGAL